MLEVHENLERPHTSVGEENALDDKEKAIVREMCNVSDTTLLYTDVKAFVLVVPYQCSPRRGL